MHQLEANSKTQTQQLRMNGSMFLMTVMMCKESDDADFGLSHINESFTDYSKSTRGTLQNMCQTEKNVDQDELKNYID